RGDAVAVDGRWLSPAEVLAGLNALGRAHGIGRLDLVENRFVGMKSRGMYETPGGTILLAAHRGIESITLDRGAAHLKDELMPKYAELIYYGFWFAPEREMLQAAIDKSQEFVTGRVRLKLYKGNVGVVGRESKYSLYDQDLVTFEDGTVAYDQHDAEAFTRFTALRLRTLAQRLRKLKLEASFSPRVRGEVQLHLPLDQHALDVGDRFGRVKVLRTGLGAVHDGMAAVQPERIFQIVEPRAGRLVARVHNKALRLQQRCRAEEALRIPPVARTPRGAARAEDAFVKAVELLPVVVTLLPFLLRGPRDGLQPRLDRSVLGVEIGHVRDQVLHHRHMRQRVDADDAADLAHRLGAGKRIGAVDIHRAGAANTLAAGAAEGQRGIDIGFDPDQRVEHHRAAIAGVDVIGIDARVAAVLRIPAVDAVFALRLGADGTRPSLAFGDFGILWQRELNHNNLCKSG